MERKMFVFDMDGTLLKSNQEISIENLGAIREAKKKGHKVVIATGRPKSDIKNFDVLDIFDYLICNNGSYYIDLKEGKTKLLSSIDKEVGSIFMNIGKDKSNLIALHFSNGSSYRMLPMEIDEKNQKIIEEEWKKFKFHKWDEMVKILEENELVQASIRSDEKGILYIYEIVKKELQNKYAIHISGEVYLDVNALNTDKYSAIKKLSDIEKISNENIIAFGDSGNDLTMIKNVGLGVAMGNGNDELKSLAKKVIGNNDSNDIAKTIYEIIS